MILIEFDERTLDFTTYVIFGFRLLFLQGGRPVSSGPGASVLQTSLL